MLPLLLSLACGADDPKRDSGSETVDCPTPSTWYLDLDGDGYGAGSSTGQGCVRPEGQVGNDQDCDDTDSLVHPAAAEICDGVDNDCDGGVDGGEADDAVECWLDSDGDGAGDPGATESACACADGWVGDGSDCDDTDATVHPAAEEVCNGWDDDCDAEVDEGLSGTWYQDVDGDGFGDPLTAVDGCPGAVGTWLTQGEDCNDLDPDIHPDALDLCDDEVDQDCDLRLDECGFDASTLPGDAWWTVYRDPETSTWGWLGMNMAAAGDSDGDGRREILAPMLFTRCASGCAIDYQYLLLEAPALTSGGSFWVQDSTIASWAVVEDEELYWTSTYQLDDMTLAGSDLDGDGYGDFVLGANGAKVTYEDEAGISRINLVYGPPAAGSSFDAPTDLADELTAFVSEEPYVNGVVALLEPPVEGSDWIIAAGAYPADDTLEGTTIPFVYLLTVQHFDGTASPDGALRLWANEPYQAGETIEAGDLDGDGIGDLLTSAHQYTRAPANRIWAFMGPFDDERSIDEADLTIRESRDGDDFASAFTLVGDLNDDGLPEIAAHQIAGCGDTGYCLRIFDRDDDCPSGECTADDATGSLVSTDAVTTHKFYVPRRVPSVSAGTAYDLAVTVGVLEPEGTQRVYLHDTPIEGSRLVSAVEHDIRTDEAEGTSGFGSDVLGGVDYDGDGLSDLVVGQYYWNPESSGGQTRGRFHVFRGDILR